MGRNVIIADPAREHEIVLRTISGGRPRSGDLYVSCNCLHCGRGSHEGWTPIYAAPVLPAAVAWARYWSWHAARGITVGVPGHKGEDHDAGTGNRPPGQCA